MHAAGPGWRRLLDHLADAGPASIEDLRTELRLKRQELNALRTPLERCGAILARSLQVTAGKGHLHSSELIRWGHAHPASSGSHADPHKALDERSVPPWSRQSGRCDAGSPGSGTGRLIDGLVGDGRLRRVDGHVATVARPATHGPGRRLGVSAGAWLLSYMSATQSSCSAALSGVGLEITA